MGPHVLGKRGSMGRPEPLQAAGQRKDPSMCADTLSSAVQLLASDASQDSSVDIESRAAHPKTTQLLFQQCSCILPASAPCSEFQAEYSLSLWAVYIARYYLLRT
ncbi:hypothetical protein IMZ48_13150 [Candidatus Bathyarchaeota archaeon]|nr:hypothetical protein [Candidatus Bathyarchaeota archaeon]